MSESPWLKSLPQADAASDAPAMAASLYRQAIAQFGPSLGRLTAGYELDTGLRQDLLQEIHLALWRSLAAFRSQCSLRTWVYRVAHNTAATWIRRQRKRGSAALVSLDELEHVADDSNIERAADETGVLARLAELIQRLKPIDRDVILLWLEGLEAAEIAEVLGLSPDNVAQKVHRTRKVLQRRFETGETP